MRWAVLALCAGLISQAAAEETLIIGAENDWYPYSGVINGQVQGITVDLVREAFKATGVTVKYDVLPYIRCMAMTKVGTLAGCFDTLRHPGIENDYLWHEHPMFSVQYQIYARSDVKERGFRPKDLEGRRVAVTRSYEYGPEFDSNPNIVRIFTPRDESNFRMLIAGRVDYTVAMALNTNMLVKKHPEFDGKFKIVGAVAESGVYTVFSKQHPDAERAMQRFNQGMAIIRRNGRYQAIMDGRTG